MKKVPVVKFTTPHAAAELAGLPLEATVAMADVAAAMREGPTLRRWRTQIIAWHHARVSNGPTEALNNLIKRIKRVAFGMREFRHYRVRVLLYAGRPNWDLLDAITPR